MKGRKAGRVGKTSTPAPTTHLLSRPALTRDGIYANALADLAYERIREAEVLLRHEHFTGAAYIVGYGVELLLKAVIANQRFAGRWPVEAVATDLKIHDLETLLKCASLHERMRAASKVNKMLGVSRLNIREWRPTLRNIRLSRGEARDMVASVREEPDGVAPWLSLWARR
jgi:hypothetical protein